MSKKIISILLILICLISLISCSENEKKPDELPPVVTEGIPEREKVTSEFESGGFSIKVYESYSEIVEYKGKDTEVTVPDAFMGIPVKVIGEYAFFENETLAKIILPDSIIVIGKGAFQDCKKLTEAVLGNKVEVISHGAFRDSALEKINVPDSVATIERYAFYRTHITEMVLPANLSVVGKYAFYGCEKLTSVTLCPRLSNISEYAFSACTSLKKVVITDRVERIGDFCFAECTSLEKIFIPKKTVIGENAFLSCESVTLYSPSKSHAESTAKQYGYSFKECASANKMP